MSAAYHNHAPAVLSNMREWVMQSILEALVELNLAERNSCVPSAEGDCCMSV